MLKNILLLILVSISSILSQVKKEWFPDDLNIQPFTANFLEPKAGFAYLLGESEIRLDIGTSSDIYKIQNGNKTLSFGADLFTYSRLRGTSEFHFPVDAIDYLFGVNAGYKIKNGESEYGARLRISHISAHFVDGNFEYSTNTWRKKPRVYSREFIEIFPFYRIHGLRGYIGLTYLINVTPEYIGKGIFQAGFDYYVIPLSNNLFTPFVAYDVKLLNIHKYSATNIISMGIKFGEYNSKGFSILISYFSGKSIHGELFDVNEKYTTLGFNLDL